MPIAAGLHGVDLSGRRIGDALRRCNGVPSKGSADWPSGPWSPVLAGHLVRKGGRGVHERARALEVE